jgi:stage II sporulation protein D
MRLPMPRKVRIQLAIAALVLGSSLSSAENVRIGVLGLFHPREFTLRAADGNAIVIHTGQETIVLEKSSGTNAAQIRAAGNGMVIRVGSRAIDTLTLTVSGRASGPADFILAVPGKITRHYRGTLELKPISGTDELIAVVDMDLEAAVASVVAAESLPGAPLEALKAQAVAARSYFLAGKGRHSEFDFCDTTHCQFLREPPGPSSAASEAAVATRGLVMVYESRPFAAMYTRSCSGRTRTPVELGLSPGNYPYNSVECKYCRKHPEHWRSQISAHDAAALNSNDEGARLKIDRRLGWSAVPSNSFNKKSEGDHVILEGIGQGHGVGLCQAGASAMAEAGANFQQILSHYYSNTTIVSLERAAAAR